MACRLGRLLDPYPTTLLFVHFPWLDVHLPAPLASTHCQLGMYGSVWCDPGAIRPLWRAPVPFLNAVKLKHL
jgi:hypothetical protein